MIATLLGTKLYVVMVEQVAVLGLTLEMVTMVLGKAKQLRVQAAITHINVKMNELHDLYYQASSYLCINQFTNN